jgi:hypothetical protein
MSTRYLVELVSRIDDNRPRVWIDADSPEEVRAKALRIVGRKPYLVRILAGVAVAALALCGCAKGPDIRDSYAVGIDPAFSAAEQQEILEAVDDWRGKVPVELDAYVGPCSPSPDGAICFLHQYPNQGCAGDPVGCTDPSDGEIQIDVLAAENAGAQYGTHVFRTVAAHELGHAMMGHEHLGVGNLMAPYLDPAVWEVRPGDVAEWYRVRGRVPPFEE